MSWRGKKPRAFNVVYLFQRNVQDRATQKLISAHFEGGHVIILVPLRQPRSRCALPICCGLRFCTCWSLRELRELAHFLFYFLVVKSMLQHHDCVLCGYNLVTKGVMASWPQAADCAWSQSSHGSTAPAMHKACQRISRNGIRHLIPTCNVLLWLGLLGAGVSGGTGGSILPLCMNRGICQKWLISD